MPRGKVESTVTAVALSPSSLVIGPSEKGIQNLAIPKTIPVFGIVSVTDAGHKKIKKGDKLLYFASFLPVVGDEYEYALHEHSKIYVAELKDEK